MNRKRGIPGFITAVAYGLHSFRRGSASAVQVLIIARNEPTGMQGRDRKWDYYGERRSLDVILRSDL
jgi:hypothetical protein